RAGEEVEGNLRSSPRQDHFREGRSGGEVSGCDRGDGCGARFGRQGYRRNAEGSEIATHRLPRLELPRRKDRDWKGVIASLLVHAVILFLILAPIVGSSDFTHDPVLGGGGEGPAGGGGGGVNGPGSRAEHVEFVRVK